MARRMSILVPKSQPISGTQVLTAAASEVQNSIPLDPSLLSSHQPESETPAIPVPPPQPRATPRPEPVVATQIQHVEPRGLAQPVGRTWANKRNNTILEAQSIKTLKVQQHEMDEQQKKDMLAYCLPYGSC